MSDSDDDLPISELIKKRKRIEEAKSTSTTKNLSIKKERDSGDVIKPTKTINSSSNSRPSSSNLSGNRATDFYENTKKGLLVQRLLLRWWYAIEWPDMENIGEVPKGYESLDGFPGVFISTRVSSCIHIIS